MEIHNNKAGDFHVIECLVIRPHFDLCPIDQIGGGDARSADAAIRDKAVTSRRISAAVTGEEIPAWRDDPC